MTTVNSMFPFLTITIQTRIQLSLQKTIIVNQYQMIKTNKIQLSFHQSQFLKKYNKKFNKTELVIQKMLKFMKMNWQKRIKS